MSKHACCRTRGNGNSQDVVAHQRDSDVTVVCVVYFLKPLLTVHLPWRVETLSVQKLKSIMLVIVEQDICMNTSHYAKIVVCTRNSDRARWVAAVFLTHLYLSGYA